MACGGSSKDEAAGDQPVAKADAPAAQADAPAAKADTPATSDSTYSLGTEFRTLWWSMEQMDGMDPNNLPPKELTVTLDHWEFTDPIGVPNPDKVDLVVNIEHKGSSTDEGLNLLAARRWKVGSIEDKESATWGAQKALGAPVTLSVAAGDKAEHIFKDIDLASMINPLFEQDKWPWELEIHLRLVKGKQQFAEHTVIFPLTPGD